MKKPKNLAALCFGSLSLVAGALALLYTIGFALFQPHNCFGFAGLFSCIVEDKWLRAIALVGVGFCISAYFFIRKCEQPKIAYAAASVVIAVGAICLYMR